MMANTLASIYEKLIDRPGAVYGIAFVLIAAGIAATALKSDHMVTDDLVAMLLSGDLLYGLFVTMLIVLVIVGARIDDSPGKSIALALGVLAAGTIVRLLLPFARSIDWLGEWNGVMLGLMIITLYLSLRVGARFAVASMGSALYTMIVTAGIALGLTDRISVSSILALMAIGAFAVVMSFLGYSQVRSQMESTRREPVSHSVRIGMTRALPFLVFAGISALLTAAPMAVFAAGPLREFGLLVMIGGPVGALAALMSAAPLLAMTQHVQVETGAPARRGGRRQR